MITGLNIPDSVHLTGYFSNHYAEMKRLVSRLRKARKAAGGRQVPWGGVGACFGVDGTILFHLLD
jgi:hypothetical protein